ncbi:RNA polymerase I-specific transcription initiation factor domain-containing protein [Trichoderma evansii]
MDRSSLEWDLDSDEIASVTSQDLHDNRPNRWTGQQRTWQRMTAEERRLWQSMEGVEDQDLAVHLYNAFALKKRGKDSKTAQDVTVTMENGQQGIWAPPKVWTAWPLNEKHVPRQKDAQREDDGYDKFTFRNAEKQMPSSELHDELGATILRIAGERFHKSKRKTILTSIEGDPNSLDPGASEREDEKTSNIPAPSSPSSVSGQEDMKRMLLDDEGGRSHGEDELHSARVGGKKRKTLETYEPVMSSNDDLSYGLIKPSVRHILSQLDATLNILHNARTATTNYASDSSATSDSESDTRSGPKRSRGRPRSSKLTGATTSGATTPNAGRRGRPRKVHVPREGETHEEMLVRIARESHRRLPSTAKERDAAFEEWLRQGDEKLERQAALLREEEELGIGPQASAQERRLLKLGLRDWSDVVGAAALAGFSHQVIARTAKRCANLFGEGMVMRRLDEVPASRGPPFHTMEYRPEKINLNGPNDDSDSDNGEAPATALSSRRTSRQPSQSRPSNRRLSSSPFCGRSSPHSVSSAPRNRSQSKSRSRSRSSAGFHFCPVPTCERSTTGFSRKQNLRRHMQLVHPGRGDEEEDWDSEDEVYGAVHVDGFLKPILAARGWRENVAASSLVIRKRGRERRTGEDDDEDEEL